MADYDPTAPLVLADVNDDENDAQDTSQAENGDAEDDEDYDPSGLDGEDSAQASATERPQPSKPKTVGGFVVDSDDEDDDEPEKEQEVAPSTEPATGTAASQHVTSHTSSDEASLQASAAQNNHVIASTPVPAVSLTSTPLPDQASHSPPQIKIATPPVQSVPVTPLPPTETPAVAAPPPTQMQAQQQKLPHDKVGELEERIKEDPKADSDAWRGLIAHYRQKEQYDQARSIYARMVKVFPTSASVWIEQLQMELELNELGNVEATFGQSLLQVPNVGLWATYLDYLRRVHPLVNDADGSKRSILTSAFDTILQNIGIDPDAGGLWREYIEFLKTGPGTVGGSGWQDMQKADQLRSAYQRAIKIPHAELTRLWKEYDTFELTLNKATGRKYLQEQSPHYMTARTARTQLEQRLEGLDRVGLPTLPPVWGCRGCEEFANQVEKWRGWLQWEKEDPLVLKEEDLPAYHKRILYVYKQATMYLRFYADIWFEAASWSWDQGTEELETEGDTFLSTGIEACPESILLGLKKVDRVESALESGSTDEVAIRNGNKLDDVYEKLHTALYALVDKTKARQKREVETVKAEFDALPAESKDNDEQDGEAQDDEEEDENGERSKKKTREELKNERVAAVNASYAPQADTLKRSISHVWVAKMRAFRRIQGQGAPGKPRKGFRGVFAEARPRGQLSCDVYIASALLEWRVYKDPSAGKIFERGLRLFPTDERFALEYIKHLMSRNDDTNARAVFETTISKISAAATSAAASTAAAATLPGLPPTSPATAAEEVRRSKCRPLFAYMHAYEAEYGDLTQLKRLEKRMNELFPSTSNEIARFSARFATPDFDVLAAQLVISPTQALPPPLFPQQPHQLQPFPTDPNQDSLPPLHPLPQEPGTLRLGPNGPYMAPGTTTDSPKRGFDDTFSDSEGGPARKLLRGESPLKGAAGRRMLDRSAAQNQNQGQGHAHAHSGSFGSAAGIGAMATTGPGAAGGFVTKNYQPGAAATANPPPLPPAVGFILSLLPNAASYRATTFDPLRMVDLLRGLDVAAARDGR